MTAKNKANRNDLYIAKKYYITSILYRKFQNPIDTI